MAFLGVGLEAKQSRGARRRNIGRLGEFRLGGRFVFQIIGIEGLHLRMAPGAGGDPARRRRAEGAQMDIVDPRLVQAGGQQLFGKPGPA